MHLDMRNMYYIVIVTVFKGCDGIIIHGNDFSGIMNGPKVLFFYFFSLSFSVANSIYDDGCYAF